MSVIDEAKARIKGRRLKLVMPEGDDERIRLAAEVCARRTWRSLSCSGQRMCPRPNPITSPSSASSARR